LAAMVFLESNGVTLPTVAEIQAEAFVLSVAKNLFDSDDAPDGTVHSAAEWLATTYATRRRGPSLLPELEYVFLAERAVRDDGGTISTERIGLAGLSGYDVPFPSPVFFVVVGRLHSTIVDVTRSRNIEATVRAVGDLESRKPVRNPTHGFNLAPAPPASQRVTESGVLSGAFCVWMAPTFLEQGEFEVAVTIEGELAATLPFEISSVAAPPWRGAL